MILFQIYSLFWSPFCVTSIGSNLLKVQQIAKSRSVETRTAYKVVLDVLRIGSRYDSCGAVRGYQCFGWTCTEI